ncbi:NucA/NucB deoxyribonuclease domain-containing protein [Thermomonospora umbrina]|uniref:Deoxyribonuclease NucA/NucB domain-containing protein n=1 Tax=Thermomonospora umbrina TaxID=111806 RepID=A0A3D9SLC4_9ACTN|nr:hypothetical protein [Thermomonospora umbrina]REE96658.1 hypothetical protein DFJ69_2101 [Thermomonospora umbrina]
MKTPEPPFPADPWCWNPNILNKGWRWYRDLACSYETRRVKVIRIVQGRVEVHGWADVKVEDWSRAWSADPSWYQAQTIQAFRYWGNVGGLTVSGSAFVCRGRNCAVAGGSYPRQRVGQHTTTLGHFRFKPIALKRGTKAHAKTSIEYVFHKPGYMSSDPVYARPPEVRCDHMLPGNSRPGCVFHKAMPIMLYSLKGPYAELAKHIRAAQISGLPGAYGRGKALKRLVNPELQKKNRNRACPSRPTRPAGLSCDEYPMASTHQGAFTVDPKARPGVLRRSHRWCRMPKVPYKTGPKGFSVCLINEKHNSNGGGALDDFYVEERVLGNDLFRIWIR